MATATHQLYLQHQIPRLRFLGRHGRHHSICAVSAVPLTLPFANAGTRACSPSDMSHRDAHGEGAILAEGTDHGGLDLDLILRVLPGLEGGMDLGLLLRVLLGLQACDELRDHVFVERALMASLAVEQEGLWSGSGPVTCARSRSLDASRGPRGRDRRELMD